MFVISIASKETTMHRRIVLILSFLTLLPAPTWSQQRPTFFIETKPARKVETIYTFEVRYSSGGTVTEWEIVAARPCSLPRQIIDKVTVDPKGEERTTTDDLKQPVLLVNFKAETEAQKTTAKIVVKTEATIMSRRLVPLSPGANAPKVPPLDEVERKAFLAATPRLNYEDSEFQKWLDTNKLRKQKKESEVDFAKRAFLAIKQTMKYKRPFNHDAKASTTCKSGQGDCGCFATVFVCALRANDVPAREVAGRWVKVAQPFEKIEYGIHVKAEFFVDRVGWVPADPTLGIEDKSPLRFFGNEAGDFLVFHFDGDLPAETVIGRKDNLHFRLQSPGHWYRGEGKLENPTISENWQVKELPLTASKKK
jgi:transglutaminase-like putative cysteine protease